MALPTVHFDRIPADTNSSLVSATMPMLHDLLIAAGWELLFADSDAIGGGTSGDPAWDATPATNTSAGRAIYKMPANGHSTQWHVQIQPGWGSNTGSNLAFAVTVGTGWDSVDALTGAGNTVDFQTGGTAVSLEFIAAASEDGFALAHGTTSSTAFRFVLVERARSFDGTVGDDLIVLGYAAAGTFFDGSPNYSCARYRAPSGLEHNSARWLLLGPTASPTAWGVPNTFTTTSSDGESNIPLGPLANSGEMSGLPRLVVIVGPNDAVPGTDHPVQVDGGVKLYWTPTSVINGAYVVLVARE